MWPFRTQYEIPGCVRASVSMTDDEVAWNIMPASVKQQIVTEPLNCAWNSFKALIGQRYGESPLPAYIRVRDYDAIRSALGRRRNRDAKGSVPLLDAYYERDTNQLDPGHYRLVLGRQVSPQVMRSSLAEQADVSCYALI